MFLESQKDITDQNPHCQSLVAIRLIKPKLISSLNYEQQYLLRRKQKRNNRGRIAKLKTTHTHSEEDNSQTSSQKHTNINQSTNSQNQMYENNFYREVYDGNDKISGYWFNGLLEGQAQIQYQNGDYFKGKFQKGYKISGIMIFKDQGSYEGAFYNQQFHGKGILKLKQKTISAQWANGIVEGSCVVQYNNGNVYYGPVKEFKKHGYGYLYFPNDTKFFGQFVDGIVKGYGEYYEKGKLKCKGLWKNGKLMQQKKQEEWSYNFEEENINWDIIEELFQKKDTSLGNGSFFEMFIQKESISKPQDDEKFKEMLESIKKSNKGKDSSTESDYSSRSKSQSETEKIW